MNHTLRTVIMAVAPLASLMTLAVGLRVGAESGVHAAMISVTPKSTATSRAYLRVIAYYDETGVKETVALSDLTLTVKVRGESIVWSGATNDDGLVDIPIDLPSDLKKDETLFVSLKRASEPYPLAEGNISAELILPEKISAISNPHALRPTKRDGDIALDVVIPDGRLAPEGATRAFVRMRVGDVPPKSPHLELHPEPGVEATVSHTCPQGFAELVLVATYHIAGMGIVVTDGDGATQKKGEWFGGLPIAMGAPLVHLPASEPAGNSFAVSITQSNARSGVYVAIDDAEGRVYSDFRAVKVTPAGAEATTFQVPALPEGLYWLTSSGDPKAIDALDGSAIARPFLVKKDPPDLCSLYDKLLPKYDAVKRVEALDGLYVRRKGDRGKKQKGLFLGLFSLAIAALLEVILMVSASRDARSDLAARMKDILDEDEARSIDIDTSAQSRLPRLAIALCIALMGFALIGAFVVWRV